MSTCRLVWYVYFLFFFSFFFLFLSFLFNFLSSSECPFDPFDLELRIQFNGEQ